MSRKRIKPIIETIPGYTEKQSQYLRGEISDSDVNGKFFSWLLKRAVAANDTEVIKYAEKRLAELKEEAAEKIAKTQGKVCIVYTVAKAQF